MKNKVKINKYIVIYFMLAFIPRFILIQFMWPLRTPLDESSTLALPAYLVGYDWTYLMGKTQYYYGYGMSIFFTPLFLLIKNPIILYRTILSMCALLQTIPGFIAFHILGKFFGQASNLIKLLLSLVATYCVATTATNVYNEHMLYIVAWIIVWMILALVNCQDESKKILYTIILAFVLFYSLTCHERAKVFVMAMIALIVLYAIFQKQCMVSSIIFIMVSSLMYKIILILTAKVRATIWPVSTMGVILNNTSASIPFSLLKKKELWYVWYNIILGQLGTGMVFTGGILAVVIVFGVWLLVRKIVFVRKKGYCVDDNYLYVILFGLLVIGATIFAQSLTWLENAQKAIVDSTVSEGGRAFTYLRYYFPCVSPIVVLTLNWLVSNIKALQVKSVVGTALFLVILLQMNFIFAIVPLIEKTPLLNYIHQTYWNFSFVTNGDWTSKYTFLPACFICIIFFSLIFFLVLKEKREILLVFLVVLLEYQYIVTDLDAGIARSTQNFYAVKDTWDVLAKMEEDNMLPDYIGVTGKTVISTNQPLRFIYQYLLQEHIVSYKEQAKGFKEAIYIESSIKTADVIVEDEDVWYVVELSENQYIYFKGSRMERYFKEEGYEYFIAEKK